MGSKQLARLILTVKGAVVRATRRRHERVMVRMERRYDLTPVFHLRRVSHSGRLRGNRHG
jgi:hypothetical protein